MHIRKYTIWQEEYNYECNRGKEEKKAYSQTPSFYRDNSGHSDKCSSVGCSMDQWKDGMGKLVRLVCRTCESGYRCCICKIWQSVFLFNRGVYDRYGNPADPCISDPEYSVDLFKKA